MNRRTIFWMAALGAACAVNTWAGCGGATAATRPGLLLRQQSGIQRASKPSPRLDQGSISMVGLWDVQFSVEGAPFDEGYDQFHSDGTEMMNDIPNPALGNICLGVFVQTGPQTYLLHHVYWNFDNTGTVIGRGIWIQNIKLDRSGSSYSGTWTMTNFDLDGNEILTGPLAPISGDLVAARITP